VVIALASRSKLARKGSVQASQWAYGLAGVRVPSPAPFYRAREKTLDLTISAVFGGLEMFYEVSELDLGEADKKKLDELDARLNVLEEKVKKL
jgi:hypothetical protein